MKSSEISEKLLSAIDVLIKKRISEIQKGPVVIKAQQVEHVGAREQIDGGTLYDFLYKGKIIKAIYGDGKNTTISPRWKFHYILFIDGDFSKPGLILGRVYE